jgi:hypothetical protein
MMQGMIGFTVSDPQKIENPGFQKSTRLGEAGSGLEGTSRKNYQSGDGREF